MAAALPALGASVDTSGADWVGRRPRAFDRERASTAAWPARSCGSCRRWPAWPRGASSFDGDPHVRTRPIGEVLDALRSLGVAVDDDGRGTLPFTVAAPGPVRGGEVVIDASASSQFVSALLLAGARYDEGVDVRHDGTPVPSLPHIEMTVGLLREHGVEVDDSEPTAGSVAPGPVRAVDLADRARPVQRRAVPGAGRGHRRQRSPSGTGRGATTQAGDALREILVADGRRGRRSPTTG